MGVTGSGYSIPISSPSYPRGPYHYLGASIVLCACRGNEHAIASLVPEPLQPLPGGLIYVWQNDLHVAGLASYHEAVIGVAVHFQGKPGQYMARLYVDTDWALAGGREIWGFPKKFGQFRFTQRDNLLNRVTERDGLEILCISLQLSSPGKAEDLAGLAYPIYNLKIIPSVVEDAPPAVEQLTALTLSNVAVHKLVEGSAKVEFGGSSASPLHSLGPVEVLKGLYCEMDFDLPYGEVVYDYAGARANTGVGVVAGPA